MKLPNFERLYAQLPDWQDLDGLLRRNLRHHGDFPKWQRALSALPPTPRATVAFEDTVTVAGSLPADASLQAHDALNALHPWRKGPFSLAGIHIDSEWRCDFKWRRIAPHIDLRGLRVLDVGCGNGYYGWRMLGAGAELVVGIDPSVLYCMQHQAVNHFIDDDRNHVLPLAFEELPNVLGNARFDAVFSMGVIYHRRDPMDHLRRLRHCLVPGGLVLVESLVTDDEQSLVPQGRYARMRNVRCIPAPGQLLRSISECGFENPRLLDTTITTTEEQRSTAWMRFHSLAEALDTTNPSLTVEGHPGPRRSLVLASRPKTSTPDSASPT